ncbi:MAG: hypothetical protein LC114_17490 [Bryobacterales bacterium]|nr:hypothetical protein [Bryobacterales bacterium]
MPRLSEEKINAAPFGSSNASIDDKGRLKLSSTLQKFLQSQPDGRLFVTEIEDGVLAIYPAEVWAHNMTVMQETFDDPFSPEIINFLANAKGGTTELDGQGRILIPARLREELGLMNGPLKANCYKGRIDVMLEAVFERKVAEAMERRAAAMMQLKAKQFI